MRKVNKQRFSMAEYYLLNYLGYQTPLQGLRSLEASCICAYIPIDLANFARKLRTLASEVDVVKNGTVADRITAQSELRLTPGTTPPKVKPLRLR